MAFVANNFVVTPKVEETPAPVETPAPAIDPNHPHLVVNGQAKRLGKTSAYLLDMLSIDNR